MKRNPIENCVKGIVFTEESKQRILKGLTDKKGYTYKSYFGRIGFGFVAAIMVSVFILASAILGNTNKIVIIKSDGVSLNWQNPNKVREYIKQNMDYKYSILYFDVYE